MTKCKECRIVDVLEECPCFPYCTDCLIKIENKTAFTFKNPDEAVKFLMDRRKTSVTEGSS